MSGPPKLPLIDILYQALNSEVGVVVETNEPARLRQKLYAAKKEDEAFACLSINTSRTRPNEELWIVKNA